MRSEPNSTAGTTTAEARTALQRHLVAHGAVPHEETATLLIDTA